MTWDGEGAEGWGREGYARLLFGCFRHLGEAAFFHALEGPMFIYLRSDSMVLSHVWLGLPGGRFQSDGGLRIAPATAR